MRELKVESNHSLSAQSKRKYRCKWCTYITTEALFPDPARHKISAIDSISAFVLSATEGFGGLGVKQKVR